MKKEKQEIRETTRKIDFPVWISDIVLCSLILTAGIWMGVLLDQNTFYRGMRSEMIAELADSAIDFTKLTSAYDSGVKNPKTDVKILVDYLCPYSQIYLTEIIPQMMENNQLRVRVYDLPLEGIHPGATYISQFAHCVAEDGDAAYVDFINNVLNGSGTFDAVLMTAEGYYPKARYVAYQECAQEKAELVRNNVDTVNYYEPNLGSPTTIINDQKLYSGAMEQEYYEFVIKGMRKWFMNK